MQPDQPYLNKIHNPHFPPSVVISIAYYKAGKQVKKIHCQVGMGYRVIANNRVVCFKQVKDHHHYGGCSP